jgi:hypothetical protein
MGVFLCRAGEPLREAGSSIAERKWGAVKPQSAVRWNDTRRPWARESFGAVPAVAPVAGGGSILNWVPIRPAVATKIRLSGIFSGQQSGNLALGVL